MHTVTLQMTEVFDRVPTGKWGTSTLFSFKTADKRILGVTVPGHPRIEPGMTITAVLQKPDNWQTLWGWVDHDTGEVVMPTSMSITAVLSILIFLLAFIVITISLPFGEGGAVILVPAITGCFLVFVFVMKKTIACWQMRKKLFSIAATLHSA